MSGEGPIGTRRGRRRSTAGVHATSEGVHEYDAGGAPGAVQRHGIRGRRESRHGGDERWRGAGLVERVDQWPRRGRARGRRARSAAHGRQFRHCADHGTAVPPGRHENKVRRLSVRLHHADGLLSHTPPGRGEHEKTRR